MQRMHKPQQAVQSQMGQGMTMRRIQSQPARQHQSLGNGSVHSVLPLLVQLCLPRRMRKAQDPGKTPLRQYLLHHSGERQWMDRHMAKALPQV